MDTKQRNYTRRDLQATDIPRIIEEESSKLLAEGCSQAHAAVESDEDADEPDELGELNFEME